MGLALLIGLGLGCTDDPRSGVLPGGVPPLLELEASGPVRFVRARDLPAGRTVLRFGVTPYLHPERLREQFASVRAHLSQTLGVEVEFVVSHSYGEHIERLVRGELDIASVSPLSWVLARERAPGLRLVASQVAEGMPWFSSYILVNKDNPADRLEELVGSRVAFVDTRSTSGFLLPYDAFLSAGLDPERDFSEVRYVGSHNEAIAALARGEVDVAATASGMLSRVDGVLFGGEGPMDTSRIRILHTAGRLRYDALVVGGDLPESAVRKIGRAFARLDRRTALGRAILRSTPGISGWVAVTDADYDGLVEVHRRVQNHRQAAGAVPSP